MTRRDSYPYSFSTVSARNARDHEPPFGAQTQKNETVAFSESRC